MRRRRIALREVRDHWEDRWAVFEIRPTAHGWPVLIGRPLQDGVSLNRTGGNRVILTTELVEHLELHRRDTFEVIDLPLGKQAIQRLRRLLGHHRRLDARAWWAARLEDLRTLTFAEFARRHGKTESAACLAHEALIGPRQEHEAGWWRAPEVLELLRSDLPVVLVAEQLCQVPGSVRRLRMQVRRLFTRPPPL